MSALPFPDIPPGPHRELVAALHDLHHRAGWPSLRRLAAEAGCSHTTVSKAFSSTRVPAWGTLELLVEAMRGDTTTFNDLWLAASSPTVVGPAPRGNQIAGRRTELTAVRHHLRAGAGLVLVAGEAGIGKTALVNAAARSTDTWVATGHCRPLSTLVPLLPVSELLRQLLREDSERFAMALGSCPAYVGSALAPLLPEIARVPPAPSTSDVVRQQLFSAIPALLTVLHEARPLAIVIEDLPWADSATLDLLETIVVRGVDLPLVGTWRTDDPDTPHGHESWRSRIGRLADTVVLGPLSVEDTATQLALLSGRRPDTQETDRVFRRSGGHPLYTEQLALAGNADDDVPPALVDLLARRLSVLDEGAWRLARALGVADRSLTPEQLIFAADSEGDPTDGLRVLTGHRLLARDSEPVIRLRHPLIAEVIRHRLVPGEATGIHRRVAELLAGMPDPPASEIAEHWRAAGVVDAELAWRIRSGEAADQHFASSVALVEWSRALELSSCVGNGGGADPHALARIHTRVIDSAIGSGANAVEVRRLVERAMAEDVPDQGRAEILLRAGDLECAHGDVETGLRLIREAVAINDQHPPTVEAGHVLEASALINASLGRFSDAFVDVEKGTWVAEQVGTPALRRRMLAVAADMRATRGEYDEALRLVAQARTALPAVDDPGTAIRVAALETNVMLMAGAPAAALSAAAHEALSEADRWGMTGISVDVTIANLAEAHLRDGDVASAERLVGSRVPGLALFELRYTQAAHAAVEVRHGRLEGAIEVLEDLVAVGNYSAGAAEMDVSLADALLWAGRPEDAIVRLLRAGTMLLQGGDGVAGRRLLVTLARSEADLAARRRADGAQRREGHHRLLNARGSATPDPLDGAAQGPDVLAHGLMWRAEGARLLGEDRLEHWVAGATEWDRLRRPHDAAYCRWRAAQVVASEGHGALMSRLLRRAAKDASGHVPLSEAILSTART